MADVITRLRVDSSEFDNKLKHASEQFQRMEDNARRTGASIAYADKEEIEFIKSLGNMETKATSAKGKLAELTKEFTDLSIRYKKWDDATKQSDAGKAMASSLERLKVRINEANADLKSLQSEIGGTGNVLENLASKFGVSTQMLTGFGAAAAALAGAAKVMSDALKSNEEMLDTWGTATESAKSVYNSFLDSLNTGDITGFLTRIREIVNAATEAYDALDQLTTFNAFNQINVQKAQTRFTEAYAGYRTGETTKSDVQQAAENWKNELETRRKMEEEAYLAKIREIAQERGVDVELLTKALSGSYGSYEALKSLGVTGAKTEYRSAGVYGDQMVAVEVRDFANEEERLGAALRRLTDTELESLQGLGAQAERTATEIAQIDKQVARVLTKKEPTANTTKADVKFAEGSIAAQEKLIADLQKKWKEAADDDSRAKIKAQIEAATAELDRLTGKVKPIEIPVVIEGEGGFTENNIAALRKEIQDAMKGIEIGSGEYIIQAKRLTDLNTFQNLLKTAVANGVQIDSMRLEGLFDNIDLGVDVPDEAWAALVDEINTQLEALGVAPIRLNFETGNLEEVKENLKSTFDEIREGLDKMSEGVNAISTLGNAFDDLKNIVEDLQYAFSGEMEAWDAMMTVFNSGIGVMQTVVNVMEAINTLSEFAAALSDIKIAKQQQETATVVAGKAAETAADLTEASASAASTGVTTGEAVSKAADSVAGIPVVGPVLAVAAAATVLGAILAAVMSARSSVGKFAEGGIVPGNSFNGDRLTANVNSGELILNRAQQNNIAAQLTAGSRNESAKSSPPYVTGDMIVLGANNYLAQTGHGEIVTTKMLRQYGLIH